ncbi:MAG: lysophospholipid acyltransferase family protein [Desulfobacterales bacterium]
MMRYSEKIAVGIFETLLKFLGLFSKKWAVRIADFLGGMLFCVDKKHRGIAMDNLTYAFGHERQPEEIKIIARQVFINLVKIVFEIGWSLNLDERHLSKHFKIDGYHHIKKAYEKGKGVLVLTAHFGNWELLSVVGAMIKFPISIVVRPLDFKPLDHFIFNLRTRFGGKIIPKERSIHTIIRSLHRGEIVVLLMDQNVDWYEGVFVDFMGHRACTSKGLALLALKTEVPVVPVFMVREKSGLRTEFGPEIVTVKTGDRQKDIETNTQEYNRVIESFIRRYPDQWFWVHQRWKTKPYQAWPQKSNG